MRRAIVNIQKENELVPRTDNVDGVETDRPNLDQDFVLLYCRSRSILENDLFSLAAKIQFKRPYSQLKTKICLLNEGLASSWDISGGDRHGEVVRILNKSPHLS